MRLGVLTTENVMSEAFPPPKSLSSQTEDLFVLESVLAVHGNQLTGIASEFNKLRVHHREILDKLPIGIVSLDQNGEILKWNEAISEYTNLDNSSAFGSSIADLPKPWNKEITSFVTSDDLIRDNVSMELDEKRRWFTFQKSAGVPVDDINDEVILLIEEKTESVLLIQKSINNERLASVGRLAAGVAHEIGNPVTGIACLAQNLEHESDSKQVLETAEHILSQTSRINRIVESLINFSRGEKSIIKNLQRVNLHEVAEETIQLLTLGDNASQVQFKANIPSDFEILGDYHQLIQVFLNLLSNSRDASTADSEVTILATEADGKIRITINDSGTGITQSLQSQLFEPFVTSKDPGKGTGLGLWVVFNLVKGLDGDITINSPAENNTCGTTVALTFNKPENQA
jgi:signal transduction histidine kinase